MAKKESARVTLTDPKLRTLKAKSEEFAIIDVSGLTLRVRPSGKMTFGWRYKDKLSGRMKRIAYGDYPYLSLLEARQIHELVKSARNEGVDISDNKFLTEIKFSVNSKSKSQHAKNSKLSFEDLVNIYFQRHVEVHATSQGPYRRLKNHMIQYFGAYGAESINKTDIDNFIEKKQKISSQSTIIESMHHTKMMYNWAVRRGICSTNPFKGIKVKLTGKERGHRRKAYYSMLQLRTLLINPDQYPLNPFFANIQKALILTGLRLRELLDLKLNEVDFRVSAN